MSDELQQELEGAEREATMQRERAKRAERQLQAVVVALSNETDRADRNHDRWAEVFTRHAEERAARQQMQQLARLAISSLTRGMLSPIETIQAFQAIDRAGNEPSPDSKIAKALVAAYDRIWATHLAVPGDVQAGRDASYLMDAIIAEGLSLESLRALAGDA